MSDVLVLDNANEPIYTTDYKDALRLWMKNKAIVLEEDWEGKLLHSESFEMNMPRVIKLCAWVARKFNSRVPLNRRNLIIRDSTLVGGRPTLICQYCGDRLTTETYSADHVNPRSRGGESTWFNLVAACKDCNSRKANKTLKEARMRLLKEPVEPSSHDPRYRFRLHLRNPRPEWSSYLYWNVELDK